MTRVDRYKEVEILVGKDFYDEGMWHIKPFPYKSGKYLQGMENHISKDEAISHAKDIGCKIIRIEGIMT